MILSQCKKGDIVWIKDNVYKSYLKVRVGDITSDVGFLMPCVDVEVLECENQYSEYQHCEFITAQCWKEKPTVEYVLKDDLNKNPDEEAAYQCAYDLSDDWLKEYELIYSYLKDSDEEGEPARIVFWFDN